MTLNWKDKVQIETADENINLFTKPNQTNTNQAVFEIWGSPGNISDQKFKENKIQKEKMIFEVKKIS